LNAIQYPPREIDAMATYTTIDVNEWKARSNIIDSPVSVEAVG